MPFKFEKFADASASYAARVAIRQNGHLGFNAGAVNKYKVSSYKYCVLFFDSTARAVGLQLTNEQDGGGFDIKSTKSNTYIRAKNFFDRFNISYEESSRHDLRKDLDSGLLYFLADETQDDEKGGEEETQEASEEIAKIGEMF